MPPSARFAPWLGARSNAPHPDEPPGALLFAARAALDAPLRLTAIALLLRPMGPWYVRPVLIAIAAAMLVSPRVLRSRTAWATAAAFIAIRIAADWPLADNHIYLLGYWALAATLSLGSVTPDRTLAHNSRWLIGLAFVFAVIWKAALAPDFRDERFFRVTVISDPRFEDAARLIGGLSREDLRVSRDAIAPLPDGAALVDPLQVVNTPRLSGLVIAGTWGVLLLEAAVAVLMLLPDSRFARAARHVALIAFCSVTYAFAPVAGFGWLLLVMGLAQTSSAQRKLRVAYFAMFLLVLFYSEVPWAALLLG